MTKTCGECGNYNRGRCKLTGARVSQKLKACQLWKPWEGGKTK